MAWYRSHYSCDDCNTDWVDEWSCCCDDECPNCGSSDWSPVDSEDVSAFVENSGDDGFTIYYSPPEADNNADYTVFATTPFRSVALILEKIAFDLAKPV